MSYRTRKKVKRYSRHWKVKHPKKIPDYRKKVEIYAPKVFSIEREGSVRNSLIEFIDDIKKNLLEGNKIKIIFENTKTLYPSGTIWFLAEMKKIIDNPHIKSFIQWIPPKDLVVYQLFKHVGLFDWFNKKALRKISSPHVTKWGFMQGNKVDDLQDHPGLIELYEKLPNLDITFEGIKEAIVNTIHHAYEDIDNITLSERHPSHKWSLFYTVNLAENKISLAICDLGIGVYNSFIRKVEERSFLDKILSLNTIGEQHAEALDQAIQYRSTRTGEKHRGKGFHDMMKVVDNSDNGWLTVLSHSAGYEYEKKSQNKEVSTTLSAFEKSSKSTIVLWSFNL